MSRARFNRPRKSDPIEAAPPPPFDPDETDILPALPPDAPVADTAAPTPRTLAQHLKAGALAPDPAHPERIIWLEIGPDTNRESYPIDPVKLARALDALAQAQYLKK